MMHKEIFNSEQNYTNQKKKCNETFYGKMYLTYQGRNPSCSEVAFTLQEIVASYQQMQEWTQVHINYIYSVHTKKISLPRFQIVSLVNDIISF